MTVSTVTADRIAAALAALPADLAACVEVARDPNSGGTASENVVATIYVQTLDDRRVAAYILDNGDAVQKTQQIVTDLPEALGPTTPVAALRPSHLAAYLAAIRACPYEGGPSSVGRVQIALSLHPAFGCDHDHGGQGAIGGRVSLRLGDDLVARVDAWATAHQTSRADAVRHLVLRGVVEHQKSTTARVVAERAERSAHHDRAAIIAADTEELSGLM